MKPYEIHIFCQKNEICSLIKKKLNADGYNVECTNVAEADKDFIENFDKQIDCIILDKDINKEFREKVKDKFPGLPIVCLPSLDSDFVANSGITYISEPLKLSELSDTITEIRLKKEIEANR
jgi:DNA-binding response OmpR family regulator